MPDDRLDSDLAKLTIDRSRRQPRGGGMGRYLTLIALAAVFGGGGYFAYSKYFMALPVQVVQATRAAGSSTMRGEAVLTAGGYIIARDVYDISTKIIGRVRDIHVERGDLVEAGDTIITLEDEEYTAQVRLAEARVASFQAQLDQLRAGSRPEEIARARAEAASAEATVLHAREDESRVADLMREGIASSEELDHAKADRSVAEANLRALGEVLRLAELGPRVEEIRMAAAQLEEAQANLEYSRLQLGYTVIRAPISGTILEKVAKKGEMVTNTNFGGTRGARSSVVSMADLTDLQVELDIGEDDLPLVHLAQNCEIQVDSHPEATIFGLVDEIAPRADRQKATVQVKIRILDPPEFLRPEVNARVRFLSGDRPEPEGGPGVEQDSGTLWIPTEAVFLGPDGSSVYIAFEGHAMVRSVATGREGPLGIEITDGLLGDERVIVSPLDRIVDGAAVDAG